MIWNTSEHLIKPNIPSSGKGSIPYLAETVSKSTELFILKSQNVTSEPMCQLHQGRTEQVEPADFSQMATSTYSDTPLGNGAIPRYTHTEVRVINETTTTAIELVARAHPHSKVICHNMGRYKDPRPEWVRTIYGQEIDFLHRTTLSASLKPSLYPLQPFQAVYSRGISIVRGPGTQGWPFLHPSARTMFDVVTVCPHLNTKLDMSFDTNDIMIIRAKIELMLSVCVTHGADIVILGAFGCGGAGNPPDIVADVFKSAIEEFAGYFSHVYFAVYVPAGASDSTLRTFATTLVGQEAADLAAVPLMGGSLAFKTEREAKKLVKVYKAEAPWVLRDRTFCPANNAPKIFCMNAGKCAMAFDFAHSKGYFHPPHCPRGPGCCISNERHRLLFVHDAKLWNALRVAESVRMADAAWRAYRQFPKLLRNVFRQREAFTPRLSLAEYVTMTEAVDAEDQKAMATVNIDSVHLDTLLPIGPAERRHLVRWCRAAGFERVYDTYNCRFDAEEFHRKCDGVAPTLVLIQANSERGSRVFGGYTGIPWQSAGPTPREGKDVGREFVFTLKNTNGFPPTAFRLAPGYKNSITFDKASGPIFGTSTIKIMGPSSISSITDDYMVTGGFNFTESQTTTFNVLGYEVFRVLTDDDLAAKNAAVPTMAAMHGGASGIQQNGMMMMTPTATTTTTTTAAAAVPQKAQFPSAFPSSFGSTSSSVFFPFGNTGGTQTSYFGSTSLSPAPMYQKSTSPNKSMSTPPVASASPRSISTGFLRNSYTETYFDIVEKDK